MKKQQVGNCYYCSEALFHNLGGKSSGWKPMFMKVNGYPHWFLKHKSGLILDATRKQFRRKVDYSTARGHGFLTKGPSKRGKLMMEKLTWRDE